MTALDPSQGPTRTVAAVTGTDLANAVVVWDAGQPGARRLPAATRGAVMFSAPAGAADGPHPVRVEGPGGRSAILTFVVTGPAANATPRIDDISLAASDFSVQGQVKVTLYVQGANIDVGAQVLVNGVVVASQADKALTTDLFGVSPAELDFPIRHYLARRAPLAALPLGSRVEVQVRNENGEMSDKRDYVLPVSRELLDSDGDGLTDLQETTVFDNGSGPIDLRPFGVDPYRKDVLLELDVMDGVPPPKAAVAGPPAQPGTLDVVRSVLANAPIMSPTGPRGINLFIDATGRTPASPFADLSPGPNIATLQSLRAQNFTPQRRGAFHYAVWAAAHPSGWSGISNVDFDRGYGDSFLVTLASFPPAFQTIRAQAETIVHELGHDLGQRHGGTVDYPFSPAYLSVMAYTWQLRASQGPGFWALAPTCTAFYYGGFVDESAANPSPGQKVVIDYSQGMGRKLVVGTRSLSERRGVCGRPVDWDQDMSIGDMPVDFTPYDPNGQLTPPGPWTFSDFPNWGRLRFDGPMKKIWP